MGQKECFLCLPVFFKWDVCSEGARCGHTPGLPGWLEFALGVCPDKRVPSLFSARFQPCVPVFLRVPEAAVFCGGTYPSITTFLLLLGSFPFHFLLASSALGTKSGLERSYKANAVVVHVVLGSQMVKCLSFSSKH